jgi:thiol peroxidase
MATTALKGTPVETIGDLPTVGDVAPDFSLATTDLSDVTRPEG